MSRKLPSVSDAPSIPGVGGLQGEVGSTSGGVDSSATTKAAHDLFMTLCDKMLAELDKLGPAIQRWIERFIDHYGGRFLPPPVRDWIIEQLDWLWDQINNVIWPQIRREMETLCKTIAEDILPWLLAPMTLKEVSGKWEDKATQGKELSGDLSPEKINAISYPISEWEGSGADQYSTTVTDQHDCAKGVADVSDQVAETLRKTATDLEDCALGLTLAVAGAIGTIAGLVAAVATAETGVGAVIGVIAAIVSFIVGIIGALIGGIEAVKLVVDGAADRIAELRDAVEELVAANGGTWPTPHAAVGSSGGMPGKTPWDDGV